jgi:hypothetical protein
MADADPISWSELEKFCAGKQHTCHALLEERAKTHALQIETERRHGMVEVMTEVQTLGAMVRAMSDTLASKSVFVLPKPILVLLCIGMVGVGVAGEKLFMHVLKYVGAQ